MTVKLAAVLALVALVAGCTTVDYEGEVYPDTEELVVVQSMSALPGDYVPIGRAVASIPAGYGGDGLVEALLEQAEEVGAHAVVVGDYRKVLVGKHLHWRYEPYSGSYDRAYDTGLLGSWSGLNFDPGWNSPRVHYDFDLELKAVFLRRASATATK